MECPKGTAIMIGLVSLHSLVGATKFESARFSQSLSTTRATKKDEFSENLQTPAPLRKNTP